jgi:hypothetical protein
MNKRIQITFLLLVLVQGLHSIEEYFGKLWEVFAPAKFLSSLVSKDPERGFLIINIILFIFGIWCWLFPIRRNYLLASGLIWFWIIIEMINGIGHPIWALYERAYVPGVGTAPILLILAIYLSKQILYCNSRDPKTT